MPSVWSKEDIFLLCNLSVLTEILLAIECREDGEARRIEAKGGWGSLVWRTPTFAKDSHHT